MRILDWKSLTAAERHEALQRPAQRDAAAVQAGAQGIIDAVRREGDAAVLALTEKFDEVRLASMRVTPQEFDAAERALNADQHAAIERAIATALGLKMRQVRLATGARSRRKIVELDLPDQAALQTRLLAHKLRAD